ncbi:hypothetical protein D3C71_1007500 [compost metagenome]
MALALLVLSCAPLCTFTVTPLAPAPRVTGVASGLGAAALQVTVCPATGAEASHPAQAAGAASASSDGAARICTRETVKRRRRNPGGTTWDIRHSWVGDQELRMLCTALLTQSALP